MIGSSIGATSSILWRHPRAQQSPWRALCVRAKRRRFRIGQGSLPRDPAERPWPIACLFGAPRRQDCYVGGQRERRVRDRMTSNGGSTWLDRRNALTRPVSAPSSPRDRTGSTAATTASRQVTRSSCAAIASIRLAARHEDERGGSWCLVLRPLCGLNANVVLVAAPHNGPGAQGAPRRRCQPPEGSPARLRASASARSRRSLGGGGDIKGGALGWFLVFGASCRPES
jgi:hypothetical protein